VENRRRMKRRSFWVLGFWVVVFMGVLVFEVFAAADGDWG
jgi:hypothetical protein